ncbi:MAG: HlyD family secretion protein [Hyphomicrobiaceae bacterium]
MKKSTQILITLAILAAAVLAVGLKYRDYLANPWTRDGQVRADVIKITPRVSGPIVNLPIKDNQFVKTGTLLFRIDPRTYKVALDKAKADYDATVEELRSLDKQIQAAEAAVEQANSSITQAEAQVRSTQADVKEAMLQLERYKVLVHDRNVSQAVYDQQRRTYDVAVANQDRSTAALNQARSALAQAIAQRETAVAKRGIIGDENSQLRSARAAMDEARLNLEFTEQRAPVDGYVTNLTLQLGSQANAGSPAMALVDVNSFWIDAYFRESLVGSLAIGDESFITLMSNTDKVIRGRVDSIAWGIAQQDGSTSTDLLPAVQPSFEWIRLAQRIPVRIKVLQVPKGVKLRVGATASVMVRTGTNGKPDEPMPPPVPNALQ